MDTRLPYSMRSGFVLGILMSIVFLGFFMVAERSWGAEGRTPISECTTLIKPGTYIITSDLTATCTCLVIDSDNVTIHFDGHIVNVPTTSPCIGVKSSDRTNVKIYNGKIVGGFTGISFTSSTSANFIIEDFIIVGSNFQAIEIKGPSGCASTRTCVRARIEKNIISGGSDRGIYVEEAEMVSIQNNTIYGGSDTGMYLLNVTGGMIQNNMIVDSVSVGIGVFSGENVSVRHNTVYRVSSGGGISISGAKGCMIDGNRVQNASGNGIALVGSVYCQVTKNTVVNNKYGIHLWSDANGNSIDWNQVSGNSAYGLYFGTATLDNVYSNNRSKVSPIFDATCTQTCANTDAGGNIQ